eukprot:Skav230596  [mRNA]  locus=scaffold3317:297975:299297:- [translate_table: standard]
MVLRAHNTGPKLYRLKAGHLRKFHPGVKTPAVYQLRNICGKVTPSVEIVPSQRGWSCPFCPVGLPYGLPRHVKQKPVQEHFRKKHPRRNTSAGAVNAARNKAYRKNKDFQPAIKAGKERLAKALSREVKRTVPLDVAGHDLVITRPDWASWPHWTKTAKTQRAGTLMTCRRCLRASNSGWEKECDPTMVYSGARAVWNRLYEHSPKNVQVLLEAWQLPLEAVQSKMNISAASRDGALHGHRIVSFRPDWKTWPGDQKPNGNPSLSTCTRCLRTRANFSYKCRGTKVDNVNRDCAAMRKRWVDIKAKPKNAKLLLAIWKLTKEEVDQRLGLSASHDPNKARRTGEASNPGPPRPRRSPLPLQLITLNVQGAANAWSALNTWVQPSQSLILGLQETNLNPDAWRALQRKDGKLGFNAYHQQGKYSVGRMGQTTAQGGVVLER